MSRTDVLSFKPAFVLSAPLTFEQIDHAQSKGFSNTIDHSLVDLVFSMIFSILHISKGLQRMLLLG